MESGKKPSPPDYDAVAVELLAAVSQRCRDCTLDAKACLPDYNNPLKCSCFCKDVEGMLDSARALAERPKG